MVAEALHGFHGSYLWKDSQPPAVEGFVLQEVRADWVIRAQSETVLELIWEAHSCSQTVEFAAPVEPTCSDSGCDCHYQMLPKCLGERC